MAVLSVTGPDGPTLAHYRRFFTTPVYGHVLLRTFGLAMGVTLTTLVIAWPLSLLLTRVGPRTARLMMIAVVLPFFTSVMVRTYAWIVILGRQGILNQYVQWSGLRERPVELLYSTTAVLIGMTYVMLPYMVLSLFGTIRGIDRNLVRAARSLGAGSIQTLARVVVPMSLPGMLSGSLLVFLLSLGFFITPALMGGPADMVLAMLVEREIEFTLNWPFGSAMAMVLLAATLLGVLVYYRVGGFGRLVEGER
jgi:putative spermidine/putrescine transport system permease protein